MKRFFLFLTVCICAVALNAQDNVLVCNFDDVNPEFITYNLDDYEWVEAPADSPASGKMVSIKNIPGNNTGAWFGVELGFTFDPRDYVGISFLAQIPGGAGIRPDFSLKLEQSADAENWYEVTRIQAWDIYKKYTGEGDWQEVQISFEKLLAKLEDELAKNPDFPADLYDRIVIIPASYSGIPGTFTLNVDDIQLRTSWTDTPVEPTTTDILICDFDNIYPFVDWSGDINFDLDDAPAGSPASDQIGYFEIPAKNEGDYIAIYLDKSFDPRDYVGISFLAQIPEEVSPDFAIKLEQSTASANRIQTFSNYDKYTGEGEWQEVRIKFDKLLSKEPGDNDDLAYRLAQNPNFPADKYDVIVIVPGAYSNLPAFTLKMDDIKLRASWVERQMGENVLICNYDDVLPPTFVSTSDAGFSAHYNNDAPAGSPASGKVLTLTVPATNNAGKSVGVQAPFKFDPRDYVGISFLARISEFTETCPETRFGIRLEQSDYYSGSSASPNYEPGRIRMDYTLPAAEAAQLRVDVEPGRYRGDGEWEEVFVSFEHMTNPSCIAASQTNSTASGNLINIYQKINNTAFPDFQPNQFDRILIMIAPWSTINSGYTMLIDDIKLRGNWEDDPTGIQAPKKESGAIHIFAAGGVINAKADDGSPVALKVYALSGQGIANGVNQIPLGTKGIYIVKATTGNASKVSKIIVQ